MAGQVSTRDAKLSAAIDRAFGDETFTFLAFTGNADVDLPRIPDIARQQFDAVGIWEAPAKRQLPHARGSIQDDTAHGWNASVPSVDVDDAALIWQPAPGDRVRRNKDNSIYLISATLPDGGGRTLFLLTAKMR